MNGRRNIFTLCSLKDVTEDSIMRSAPDGAAVQPGCLDTHFSLTNAQRLSLTGLSILSSCISYKYLSTVTSLSLLLSPLSLLLDTFIVFVPFLLCVKLRCHCSLSFMEHC